MISCCVQEINIDMTEKRVYEASFHINPVLSDDKLESKFQSVKDVIGKASGEIIAEGAPYKLGLAYPIEGEVAGQKRIFDEAYFAWVKFEGGSDTMEAVNSALKSDPEIVRFLTVKTLREETFVPRERAQSVSDDDSSDSFADNVEETVELTEEGEKELDAAIEEMIADK